MAVRRLPTAFEKKLICFPSTDFSQSKKAKGWLGMVRR
jgi:hypothetical protein